MKFDFCIMNPPYYRGMSEKFLVHSFGIADRIISVQPLTWLHGKNKNNDIISMFQEKGGRIETLNGNDYFDAAFGGNASVNYLDLSGKIFYNGKEYENIEDIKWFSHDKVLMSIYSKLGGDDILSEDNLDGHLRLSKRLVPHAGPNRYYEENPNSEWWVVRVQGLRGHVGKDDFYTIISNKEKTIEKSCGKYTELDNVKIFATNIQKEKKFLQFYFPFESEREMKGFINYIKSDFVRMLLYFHKYNISQIAGVLKFIPWFDFSDELFSLDVKDIDSNLFAKYNIDEREQEYIKDILPDYYGVR